MWRLRTTNAWVASKVTLLGSIVCVAMKALFVELLILSVF